MKRFFLLGLLCLFLQSQLQLGVVYANMETPLEKQKQSSEMLLEKVESLVETTVEKLEATLPEEKHDELQEKQEEIFSYLQESKEDIATTGNTQELQELLQEVKIVVTLKIVAGTSDYENALENIDDTLVQTQKEKLQAETTLQESLESKNGDIFLLIQSSKQKTDIQKIFDRFQSLGELKELSFHEGIFTYELHL